MSNGLSKQQVEALKAKKLVFTVTAGRTGTNYLQKLFELFPDTMSVHEGEPDFVRVLRRSQQNPIVAYDFCVQQKLPFIAGLTQKRYVESGHLFCKGFIEAFLRCGIVPDLILLRRPPREIATSLLKLDTVPGRTPLGFLYLVSPDDPNVMPLLQWQYLSDYQLCFWYCLEIERRQLKYGQMFRELGATVVETQLSEMREFDKFTALAGSLGFEASESDTSLKESFSALSGTKHNEKIKKTINASPEEFAAAEKEVWDRVFYYEPLLRSKIEALYGGVQ